MATKEFEKSHNYLQRASRGFISSNDKCKPLHNKPQAQPKLYKFSYSLQKFLAVKMA